MKDSELKKRMFHVSVLRSSAFLILNLKHRLEFEHQVLLFSKIFKNLTDSKNV